LVTLPKFHDVPPAKTLPKSSTYPLRRRQSLNKKISDPKIKRITKFINQRQSLSTLLSRKIHRLLKEKEGLGTQNSKEISLSLSRELLCSGGGGPEEVIRLFKWLSISSADTIANFYENWGSLQTDKERASNITT